MNNARLRALSISDIQTVGIKSDVILNSILHNAATGKQFLVYPITHSIRFYVDNIDAVLSRIVAAFPEVSVQVRTGYPSKTRGYEQYTDLSKISTTELAATADIMDSLPLHLVPDVWLVIDWSDS